LLWSSTAASNLADGMALVALPLLALEGGAAPAGVAIITVAMTLAWPLVGLQAGWFVDRFPKRVILLAGNLARGAAFGGIAVWALLGTAPLWAIVAAAAVYGVGETLVDTSLNASIPAVVPIERRTRANSAIEGAITVTNGLVGRPLAGALIGLGFVVTFGTVAALYLAGGVLAAAIVALSARAPATDAVEPASDQLGAGQAVRGGQAAQPRVRLRDGLATLWRHRTLRNLTILTSLANLVWSMFEALFVVYAVAPGPLGLTPTAYGLVLSLAALGGIGASLLGPLLIRRSPLVLLLFVDMIGTLLLVLPVALGAPLPVVVAGIVLAASGSTLWRIIVSSYRQQEVEEQLLGRVYSAYRVISWGSLPIGAGIAAVVAAVAGVGAVFWVASGIAAAITVLFVVLVPRHPPRLG
jgi:MFS family permease